MAHFAQLNDDNVVTQVIVVNNDVLGTPESEAAGIAFCQSLIPGRWVQTSYSGSFRGKYAGIGDRYDEATDTFISPETL
jgi:hypothetical protein